MRSRIAIFEGYGNPRSALGSALGRRGRVSPKYRTSGGKTVLVRDGYRVKPMRDTPGMKKAKKRFAKCARVCSKKRTGKFSSCIARCVKSKKRSKR